MITRQMAKTFHHNIIGYLNRSERKVGLLVLNAREQKFHWEIDHWV